MSAPAEAVFCFLIFVLSHLRRFFQSLSQRNTCRTSARTSRETRRLRVFTLSHVPCSIRSITKRHLLLPTSQCRPSRGLPYGQLATLVRGGLTAFPRSTGSHDGQLRGTWTPVTRRTRAGALDTCHLATHANTRKHAYDLLAHSGLAARCIQADHEGADIDLASSTRHPARVAAVGPS